MLLRIMTVCLFIYLLAAHQAKSKQGKGTAQDGVGAATRWRRKPVCERRAAAAAGGAEGGARPCWHAPQPLGLAAPPSPQRLTVDGGGGATLGRGSRSECK